MCSVMLGDHLDDAQGLAVPPLVQALVLQEKFLQTFVSLLHEYRMLSQNLNDLVTVIKLLAPRHKRPCFGRLTDDLIYGAAGFVDRGISDYSVPVVVVVVIAFCSAASSAILKVTLYREGTSKSIVFAFAFTAYRGTQKASLH